jgi:transposase
LTGPSPVDRGQELWKQGVKPTSLAATEHGSGPGKLRWVVERTFAWLHFFRRLRLRWERRPELHEAFMHLGCAIICQRRLRAS